MSLTSFFMHLFTRENYFNQEEIQFSVLAERDQSLSDYVS